MDKPTKSFEVMRLIISITAERKWCIGTLDMKATYLQATGFRRKIFVVPPKEDADRSQQWQLEKPAHGLVECGRLWFLTSFRTLEAQNLRPCPYDNTLFRSECSDLFVTTQVDNFIYTGMDRAIADFESYIGSLLTLSELERDNFTVYGTTFSRNSEETRINQSQKMMKLEEYRLSRERRRMHEEPVILAQRLI
jgi:hypothetical protein